MEWWIIKIASTMSTHSLIQQNPPNTTKTISIPTNHAKVKGKVHRCVLNDPKSKIYTNKKGHSENRVAFKIYISMLLNY